MNEVFIQMIKFTLKSCLDQQLQGGQMNGSQKKVDTKFLSFFTGWNLGDIEILFYEILNCNFCLQRNRNLKLRKDFESNIFIGMNFSNMIRKVEFLSVCWTECVRKGHYVICQDRPWNAFRFLKNSVYRLILTRITFWAYIMSEIYDKSIFTANDASEDSKKEREFWIILKTLRFN